MKDFDSSLYFITDSTNFDEKTFLNHVEQALQGGVTLLQLREKERSTEEYLRLAKKVHTITRKYQVPLIIDDNVEVALSMHAEGVHLGMSDMPIAMARKQLGPKKIIGATAKSVARATEAYRDGADYLGVGAIYPTTTKVNTVLTSVDTLREICAAVPLPVNAIGGLTSENLSILAGIPIAGICVVSAIMKAEQPREAAIKLKNAYKALQMYS